MCIVSGLCVIWLKLCMISIEGRKMGVKIRTGSRISPPGALFQIQNWGYILATIKISTKFGMYVDSGVPQHLERSNQGSSGAGGRRPPLFSTGHASPYFFDISCQQREGEVVHNAVVKCQ